MSRHDPESLTRKQQLFCEYYVESHNAVRSYMKAYKCSYETAGAKSCLLLKLDKVKKFISEYDREFHSARIASAEEVLSLLTQMARGELLEDNYVVRKMGQHEPDQIEVVKRVPRAVQKSAMDTLAKRYGLLSDNQVQVTVGVQITDDIGKRLRSNQEEENEDA